MKTRMIFLVMVMLALCRPVDADWRIDQSKFLRYVNQRELSKVAPQGPCQYKTLIDCQNAIKEYARQMASSTYASMAECVECGGSGGSFQGTPEQQLALGLIGNLIKSIFSEPDTSRQDEIERQNAIKLQQLEEQKRQAAIQAANQEWIDLQNKEQEKRKIDDQKKLAAAEDLLAKIETVGGSELKLKTIGTDFFGTGKSPEVKLQPIGTNSYPTSKFSSLERLRGTAYFFGNALDAANSGDYENASFLGEQADKVIQGQATNVECKLAAVPDVPEPPDPQQMEAKKQKMANLLSTFQKDVKVLQDIEIKLYDTKVQIKEAESKKEAAKIKLEKVQNIAATAKPEEKPQADDLLAQALAALQNAEGELTKAKQSENEMIKEKENLKNDLKDINTKIKAEGE